MIIQSVKGEKIKDSRGDFTIKVVIKTNVGVFEASSPNGKSKGKHEAKPYKKSLDGDIKKLDELSDYFSKEYIEKFDDLRRIEDIVLGHIGANTLFALESATLKALSKEKEKKIWELINSKAKKIPKILGNAIGGGLHSKKLRGKKPEFQEFLIISDEGSAEKNKKNNLKIKNSLKEDLAKADPYFNETKNDEDAWITSLSEKEILDILEKKDCHLGVDVAANSFFKRRKYKYENPLILRTPEEQLQFVSNLIKRYNLYYIEDPFNEEDFLNHSKLLKLHPKSLIVGDDLTVSNFKRLEKAVEEKAINGIILKPNQNGSLIDFKRICKYCKEKNIKMIFSHRSGETEENILSDLAVGFGADFMKIGITGKVREAKINRLVEIEKEINE